MFKLVTLSHHLHARKAKHNNPEIILNRTLKARKCSILERHIKLKSTIKAQGIKSTREQLDQKMQTEKTPTKKETTAREEQTQMKNKQPSRGHATERRKGKDNKREEEAQKSASIVARSNLPRTTPMPTKN